MAKKHENNRVWLPEIGLALGYEQGEHSAWVREWLYWYDANGNRYLTAEERAVDAEERAINAEKRAMDAEAIANQERLAKQEAEQKAQRLVEKLKAIGINADEL